MIDGDKEVLIRAAAHVRDRDFATLATLIIGLAAETHPEELRTALAKVFDLSAIEDLAKRSMNVLAFVQRQAYECRELLAAIRADIEEIERRMDRLTLPEANGRPAKTEAAR